MSVIKNIIHNSIFICTGFFTTTCSQTEINSFNMKRSKSLILNRPIVEAVSGKYHISKINNNEIMNNCFFCRMVNNGEKCYKIWEDGLHLAFLSIFPNTPGVTVVIPKKHLSSYIFAQNADDVSLLMEASKIVADIITTKLENVARVALVFEGYGVDHLHAKLFPMHGTQEPWTPIKSKVEKYFETYEGYISSHDGSRATEESLEKLVKILKS